MTSQAHLQVVQVQAVMTNTIAVVPVVHLLTQVAAVQVPVVQVVLRQVLLRLQALLLHLLVPRVARVLNHPVVLLQVLLQAVRHLQLLHQAGQVSLLIVVHLQVHRLQARH